jgi:hypothetical protein
MVGFPSLGDDGNFIGGFGEAGADFTLTVSDFVVATGAVVGGVVVTGVVAGVTADGVTTAVGNATPTHRWFRYEI